jgi:hemerythrin
MGSWKSVEWSSFDPAIDDEHQKLHQMISSLTAVVARNASLGLGMEAVDIMTERMKLHFGLEEQAMGGADPDSCSILHEDHQRLLGLLRQIRQVMGNGHYEEATALARLFSSELAKHDQEIDVPLFRMVAGRDTTKQQVS